MSEIDVKNTIEQFFREGFNRGYELGREGATGNKPPNVRFEWRGKQPVITIERPTITVASPTQIRRINGHG